MEEEPLVLEMSRNYRTFRNHNSKHKQRRHPYYSYSTIPLSPPFSWPSILMILFLVVGLISSSWNHHRAGPDRNNFKNTPENSMENKWTMWDYNAYHNPSSDKDIRFLFLLAQQDDDDRGVTDITSLPNRAYARQRGLDYVRFREEDLLVLLQSSYDTIAFFPSNAIMIHLDHSLHEVLPTIDQVMTIGNATGFFVLNMQHADTWRVIAQWQKLPSDNDRDALSSLRSFLVSQVPHTMISYLPEQPDGFVGTNRLLQCLPRREPLEEYQTALSITVASVCYRYYPKCEVL